MKQIVQSPQKNDHNMPQKKPLSKRTVFTSSSNISLFKSSLIRHNHLIITIQYLKQ